MKLVSADYFVDLSWNEGEPISLIIECPEIMTAIVEELYKMCLGEDGSFTLSNGNKEIKIDKSMEIIINPFCIDFNSKQIQNRLYTDFTTAEETFVSEKNDINSAIVNYIEKVSNLLPYDMINYELNLDTVKLIKMYEVKISCEYQSLIERILEYIKIISMLLKKKLLVFVNLSSYITAIDIKSIIEMAGYYKIDLLFIDNKELGDLGKTFIIDNDKCMIEK